jgi:hypothetical protein
MQPEYSLECLQVSASGPYAEADKSSSESQTLFLINPLINGLVL